MWLRLTLVTPDGSAPVEIDLECSDKHTVSHLVDALVAEGLAPPGAGLSIGGVAASPTHRLGHSPFLDGAVVLISRSEPPTDRRAEAALPAMVLRIVSGPDSGRAVPLTEGRYVLGRGRADIVVADRTLSRSHLVLTVGRSAVTVQATSTTNTSQLAGVTLDASPRPLQVGDVLVAGRTRMTVTARPGRGTRPTETGQGTLAVNPVARVRRAPSAEHVEFPRAPESPRPRRFPWVVMLVPLPLAGALALMYGPRMLLLGLLSPVMMLASHLADRSGGRRDQQAAEAGWREGVRRARARLDSLLGHERADRMLAAPDPLEVVEAALLPGRLLWQRRPGAPDQLALRIGLADLPARVTVSDAADPSRRERPVLPSVPAVVPIAEHGPLGVVGDDRAALCRALLVQALVLHSPHDLVVWLLGTRPDPWWHPLRAVPHVRRDLGRATTARVATSRAEAGHLLAELVEVVEDRDRHGDPHAPVGPRHLVVVSDVRTLRADPSLAVLLLRGQAVGVHLLVDTNHGDDLPRETAAVVRVGEDAPATLELPDTRPVTVTVDGLSAAVAEDVGRHLMRLSDATPSSAAAALPVHIRLVDLLGIAPDDPGAVLERWDSHAGSTAVPVGVAGDAPFVLDLVTDGPHVLVAGTTGSGKSELLQTWVASLAVHLDPEEVSFVLVDYKGGAAFAQCAEFPHTVGVLTDLEPDLARRAITSLDAELTRRERLLAAVHAKGIEEYRTRAGRPLPRLVIIIDEFRMLAEEQPDILAALLRIAAVGRSLGVHLVLATQRPGGIVSADIRANVNLRIALRVRDRADSIDVLDAPDAASLPEDVPGRALASTGGDQARTFQSARVGGAAPTAGLPRLRVRRAGEQVEVETTQEYVGPTDLSLLVASVRAAADARALAAPHRPWLPPLPATLDEPPPAPPGPVVSWGLVDRPDEQSQTALGWSPLGGHHWGVIGGPRSGRSTTLHSIVTRAAATLGPGALHVHVVGDGSAASLAPTRLAAVGSVVDHGDVALLRRLVSRLRRELVERRAGLRAAGFSSIDEWRTTDDAEARAAAPPWLLLAVDDWHRFSRPDDRVLADLGDELVGLVRDSASAGLRLVVAGGREVAAGRLSSLLSERLVLHLADPGDAALSGVHRDLAPGPGRPGRGVLVSAGTMVQVALPTTAVPAADAARDEGATPWVVAPLPDRVGLVDLPAGSGSGVPLGVGGDDGALVRWVPEEHGRRLLVAGPPGSGRTTALRTVAQGLITSGRPLVWVSTRQSPADLACATGLLAVCRPTDRDLLLRLRQEHPDLAVVVDDADTIDDQEVGDVLREVVRRVDVDSGAVILSATTSTATTQLRGLVADVARARTGLLLNPGVRGDGDAFGARGLAPLPALPGRGYLVVAGQVDELQVAWSGDYALGPSSGRSGLGESAAETSPVREITTTVSPINQPFAWAKV